MEAAKSLFKECFGYAYEDSYELKGSNIFEKYKLLKIKPHHFAMSDEQRQSLTAELHSKSPNMKYSDTKKAASALAGLKFASEIFILLKNFDCKFICSLARFGVEVPLRSQESIKQHDKTSVFEGDDNYVVRLLNELEINVYETIFDFTNQNRIYFSNIYPDHSDYKADILRKNFFTNSHRIYIKEKNRNFKLTKKDWENALSSLKFSYNFEVIDGRNSLPIKIADIIIFIINYSFDQSIKTNQSETKLKYIYECFNSHSKTNIDFIKISHIKSTFKPLDRFSQNLHRKYNETK